MYLAYSFLVWGRLDFERALPERAGDGNAMDLTNTLRRAGIAVYIRPTGYIVKMLLDAWNWNLTGEV